MFEVYSDVFDVDEEDTKKQNCYQNYLLLLKQIKNNPETMGLIRDDLMLYHVNVNREEYSHKVVWWAVNGAGRIGPDQAA